MSGDFNMRRIAVLLWILLGVASAQNSTQIRGTPKGTTPSNDATVEATDANHNALDVTIAGGSGAGTVTVVQPVGTNLHVVVDNTAALGTPVNITSNQVDAVSVNGANTVTFNVLGTYTGNLVFEVTVDGTNWLSSYYFALNPFGALTNAAPAAAATGQFTAAVGGYNGFRVRGNTVATGTATVVVNATSALPLIQPVYLGGMDQSSVFHVLGFENSTGAPELTKTAAVTDGAGNSNQQLFCGQTGTCSPLPVFHFLFNGTTWDRARDTGADSGTKTGQTEVAQAQTFARIVSTSATAVKATAGILHRIIVNTPVASATIGIFNLATASCTGTPATNQVGVITLPSTITGEIPISLEYDAVMSNGICIQDSSATVDITVIFQ